MPLTLPYQLSYRAGILPPNAEDSGWPCAHPHINCKVKTPQEFPILRTAIPYKCQLHLGYPKSDILNKVTVGSHRVKSTGTVLQYSTPSQILLVLFSLLMHEQL